VSVAPQRRKPARRIYRWWSGLALENRRVLVAAVQVPLVVVSNYLAFWLRFEGAIPPLALRYFADTIVLLVAIRALMFVPFRLYSGLWQYTGALELFAIVAAVASSSALFTIFIRGSGLVGYSWSILVIDAIVLILLLTGLRFSKRLILHLGPPKGDKRVLIVGAGDAGEMIAREMLIEPCGYEPVGFVDDDANKAGQRIHGVPVLGTVRDLDRIVTELEPHEVLVAMPSVNSTVVRAIVESLRPSRLPIRTLPAVRDILDGRVTIGQIRDLTIADLLPRPAIDLTSEPLRQVIGGRRVLVTGAGGSIGSELARQIRALAPASLVLFERYENGLYEVSKDLVDQFGSDGITSMIGDVTDSRRVHQVLEQCRPHVIFHAAAHKHVPMMEHNPCEAIKNNVVGTATVARAADLAGVDRFIMISTDKAVNPSSVMGATKRIDELLLQVMSRRSQTRFATVRFGNVLGSNGSVVPRFLNQIKAGGPVTVTHPDMRRYFMLISEAAQLVLHAAALGEPGMIYVLDMGEQLSLLDMARNMIRLSGFVPDLEIPITFAGLRPGEKLFEELVGAGETAEPSPISKILRIRDAGKRDLHQLESDVAELVRLAVAGDSAAVIHQLGRVLPTFTGALPRTAAANVVRFPPIASRLCELTRGTAGDWRSLRWTTQVPGRRSTRSCAGPSTCLRSRCQSSTRRRCRHKSTP
jgi:FlaA1/EpsC-like NDP-sugar epimerase